MAVKYEYEDPKFPRIQVRERNNAPSTPASVHETQINSCSSKPAVSMQMELAISGLERSNIFNYTPPSRVCQGNPIVLKSPHNLRLTNLRLYLGTQ